MKTQNNPSDKKEPGKNKPATEQIKVPKPQKNENAEENDIDNAEEELDSTTPDPTKPDEETSHKKKHKIGFKTK